jgi:hypothetical protein
VWNSWLKISTAVRLPSTRIARPRVINFNTRLSNRAGHATASSMSMPMGRRFSDSNHKRVLEMVLVRPVPVQ